MNQRKTWRESQQQGNRYTSAAYVFNLTIVAGIAIALFMAMLYLIQRNPEQTSRLFLLRSGEGAALEPIPFQSNDFASLLDLSEGGAVELERFNDQSSFAKIIKDFGNKTSDVTTSVFLCSAHGWVIDDIPVIRTTDDGGSYSALEFLKELTDVCQSENCIVIFDCNYHYSNPKAYATDPSESDTNQFLEVLKEELQNKPIETKSADTSEPNLIVMGTTSKGEIPLYSFRNRRTAFSLALEKTIQENHKNGANFFTMLAEQCQSFSGSATQTPQILWPATITESLSIAGISTPQPIEGEVHETTEETQVIDEQSLTQLKAFVDVWEERNAILKTYQDNHPTKNGFTPDELFPEDWEEIILDIQTSIGRASSDTTLAAKTSFTNLEMRGEHLETAVEMNQKFEAALGKPETQSSEAISTLTLPMSSESIHVLQAFRTYFRAKKIARYAVALYDTISWIEVSEQLSGFESAIAELLTHLNNELFATANPREIDHLQYQTAQTDLERSLFKLKSKLNLLTTDAINGDSFGCAREMLIINYLASPLIELEFGGRSADITCDKLLENIKNLHQPTTLLINGQKRLGNEANRKSLYQELNKHFQTLQIELDGTGLQCPLAYRLPTRETAFLSHLSVLKKPVEYNLTIRDTEEFKEPKQVELDWTSVDLSLQVTEDSEPVATSVDLILKIKPENAPFLIKDRQNGKEVRKVGGSYHLPRSDGVISIMATSLYDNQSKMNYELEISTLENDFNSRFTQNQLRKKKTMPLRLPGKNEVLISATLNSLPRTDWSAPGQITDLRPWPTRTVKNELKLEVMNSFHFKKDLVASIYPCPQQKTTMPGCIREIQKESILASFDLSSPLLVSEMFTLQPQDRDPTPTAITWKATASDETADTTLKNGFICHITEVEADPDKTSETKPKSWSFLFSTFPNLDNSISITSVALNEETDAVELRYRRNDAFADSLEPSQSLTCRLGNQNAMDPIRIDANTPETITLIKNWSVFEEKYSGKMPLLHLDFNGWPRRYTYIIDNARNFLDAENHSSTLFPDVDFQLAPAVDPASPMANLNAVGSDDPTVRQAFGYAPKKQERPPFAISGILRINCGISQRFIYPNSNDFVEIKFGNNEIKRYYFPRELTISLMPNKKNKRLIDLSCTAEDYLVKRDIRSSQYEIDPLSLSGRPFMSKGKTRIIFDSQPPKKPNVKLTIKADKKITPTNEIPLSITSVEDNGNGVGIQRKSPTHLIASFALRSNPDEETKASLVVNSQGSVVAVVAPQTPGEYILSVRVKDRLGNISVPGTALLKVFEKSAISVPKYRLQLAVFIASSPLQANQKIGSLTIEPGKGISQKRKPGTNLFDINGLQAGTPYRIKGTFKTTLGIQTAGEIQIEIPPKTPTGSPLRKKLRLTTD